MWDELNTGVEHKKNLRRKCNYHNVLSHHRKEYAQGWICTRATWAAAECGASKRAAKMRVYVHFSSKFLNINFQYLNPKNLDLLYYESYQNVITVFIFKNSRFDNNKCARPRSHFKHRSINTIEFPALGLKLQNFYTRADIGARKVHH